MKHWEGDVPYMLQSSNLSSSPSLVLQVCILPQFLDQKKIITSNRFMLKMVKGHYLQLRCHLQLFHKQFNIKVSLVHLSIIKEVGRLLAKGTTEPSTGGSGFNFNMYMVPMYMGGLCPIFDL